MIIYLIILGVAVCALIAWRICEKKCDWFSSLPDFLATIGFTFAIFAVFFGIGIGVIHSPRYQERKLHEWQLKREAIVWQMENDQYVGGTLDEYNTFVYHKQYQHNNPWTSWFVWDYITELELIDTGEASKEGGTE